VIELDVDARELRVVLTADELEARLRDVVPPAPRYRKGVLARYAAGVASASRGAVLE
jgi:dihydroxy-acid dehydratase